jgi:hypothetical protein
MPLLVAIFDIMTNLYLFYPSKLRSLEGVGVLSALLSH